MDRLIGGFVDIASIEAGRLAVTLEPGDPTLVAMEAVEIFHAQASALGVSLTTEMELPPSVVIFDPARILQVLANLLGNAMKFTPAQAGSRFVCRGSATSCDSQSVTPAWAFPPPSWKRCSNGSFS